MAVYSVCYRCFLAFCSQPCWVGVDSSGVTPNNSFNPNPLRSTNNMAGRACHVVSSTTQVGLTQALYVYEPNRVAEPKRSWIPASFAARERCHDAISFALKTLESTHRSENRRI